MPALKVQLSGTDAAGGRTTLVFDQLPLTENDQYKVIGGHIDYVLPDGAKGHFIVETCRQFAALEAEASV